MELQVAVPERDRGGGSTSLNKVHLKPGGGKRASIVMPEQNITFYRARKSNPGKSVWFCLDPKKGNTASEEEANELGTQEKGGENKKRGDDILCAAPSQATNTPRLNIYQGNRSLISYLREQSNAKDKKEDLSIETRR